MELHGLWKGKNDQINRLSDDAYRLSGSPKYFNLALHPIDGLGSNARFWRSRTSGTEIAILARAR